MGKIMVTPWINFDYQLNPARAVMADAAMTRPGPSASPGTMHALPHALRDVLHRLDP
jgi:hypothetical protein